MTDESAAGRGGQTLGLMNAYHPHVVPLPPRAPDRRVGGAQNPFDRILMPPPSFVEVPTQGDLWKKKYIRTHARIIIIVINKNMKEKQNHHRELHEPVARVRLIRTNPPRTCVCVCM